MAVKVTSARLNMIVYFILCSSLFVTGISSRCDDPMCNGKIKSTTELIVGQGFTPERHQVESGDGFLLSLTRIPNKGPPVLLMHGALLASDSWVLRGRNLDLAFLLADLDYDVWLGDARGNSYSRSHRTLSPSNSKFWDFSVHEMGLYDLPASIDYILEITGQKSIFYIGHSLGTTMMFVMSSMKPEYVYKVRLMIGLAPAAFFRRRINIPLLTSFIKNIYLGGRDREILPRSEISDFLANSFCSPNYLIARLCLFNLHFVGYGSIWDRSQVNMSLLPEVVSHLPAGLSAKTVLHLVQLQDSGRFCQFDYGRDQNIIRYGSSQPPDYDLLKATMPVLLFYGEQDILVNQLDVKKLADMLPNLIGSIAVPLKTFNHMDFIWGMDAKELLYDDVIKSIKKYS